MKEQICFITGSTDGIGKAAAASLAAKGAIVIVSGRNEEKCIQVSDEIKTRMHNKNIFYEVCDLSSLSQVKELAHRLNKNYPKIDVLVNNAGLFTDKFQKSEDGIEMQFAVNHVAHFLLTNLLLPKMKEAESGKIINVSSTMHRGGKINFEDINLENNYNGIMAYRQSKLANVLFTYELARRLAEENINGINVNALHPGTVKTDIGRKNTNDFMKAVSNVAATFAISPEKGAETIVYLASSKQAEKITSKYYLKGKEVKSSELSYNVQLAKRLWNISKVMCTNFM